VIALGLAFGWAGLIAGAAVLNRPLRVPVHVMTRPSVRPKVDVPGAVDALGRFLLVRLGIEPEPRRARQAGAAVLGGVVGLPGGVVAIVPAAVAGWALPSVAHRRDQARRAQVIAAELPEAVDLLQLAVGAGLSVHQALAAVTRRLGGPLGDELTRALAEAGRGQRLADALDAVPARAGEVVRPLVAALTACERYGAPLAAGLERLAADVRADNRRRAEAAARRVPVKLLFPLVVCILPAFGLLTVAPLVAGALRSLRL